MTREEFADRFRSARVAAGLTQAAAAVRLGIAQPRIARIESGKHVPSVVRALEIIDVLGLDPRIVFPELFVAVSPKRQRQKLGPQCGIIPK